MDPNKTCKMGKASWDMRTIQKYVLMDIIFDN